MITLVSNQKNIPRTVKTILESMKRGEQISCLVQPAFFIHFDKDLRGLSPEEGGLPDISEDMILQVDITLKELKNINDLYKDGTTFFQVLEKPSKPEAGDFRPGMSFSTASPFTDSIVKL